MTIRWGGAIFKAIELTIKFVLRPLIHRTKVEALLFMEAGRVVVYKIDHDHLVHFNDKKKYCLSCSYFIFNIVSNKFWLYQDEGYLLKIKSREDLRMTVFYRYSPPLYQLSYHGKINIR